ncbi:hypothetical protein RI129_007827 [Pyrocoelia pectoralis]|uniref:Peptidase S1 domain-containing protein n=1 Tax=Pyrocoelia pectoralis TaxID=417401 RepID=A0AAN7ZHC5_9COLE
MFARIYFFLLMGCAFTYGKDVLPEKPDCGQQIVDSGMELRRVAKEGEFPWTVLLKYEGANPFKCVGSLINDRYVLTSSVCVTAKNQKVISALLGVHVLSESPYSEEYGIEKIIPHGDFKKGKKEFNHDIALIKLNTTVRFSDYIKPVCLPTKGASLVQPEGKVITTGWGKNTEGDQVTTKKVVVRRVITNEVCGEAFAKYNITITDYLLCTDSLKDYKDSTCSGDGGAPVVFKDEGTWYQEGIVSFGSTCGHDFPDGNTRVSKYIAWINEKLGQN